MVAKSPPNRRFDETRHRFQIEPFRERCLLTICSFGDRGISAIYADLSGTCYFIIQHKQFHRCSEIGTFPFFQTKSSKARTPNFLPCVCRAFHHLAGVPRSGKFGDQTPQRRTRPSSGAKLIAILAHHGEDSDFRTSVKN
jgi:hypothetical protein